MEGNKERFVQKKSFLFSKGGLLRTMKEVCANRKILFVKKVDVLGQQAKFFANERFLCVKRWILRVVYKAFVNGNF